MESIPTQVKAARRLKRPPRELDEVAYLRFASVYRAFGSVDDFEREIQMLRTEREVQNFGAEHPVEAPAGTD